MKTSPMHKTTPAKKINPNQDAIKKLWAHIEIKPLEAETVLIENAVSRVLAEEVCAAMDNPPYSKSEVDGYVLLVSYTAMASPRHPLTFNVEGEIPPPSQSVELPDGKARKVKKGGYMAIKRFLEGHYAVVAESEAIERSSQISIYRRIPKHENISVQGSICRMGKVLFPKGYRIRSRDVFMLASQGIVSVQVSKPPRVAIFSIGNELLPPTQPYKIGYKYDCNSSGLSAMVEEIGGCPHVHGVFPNKLGPLAKKLVETIKEVDMILLSGGGGGFSVDLMNGAGIVGKTETDEIVEAMKWSIVASDTIHPNVLGIIGQKPVICLAGDPTQAGRGFRVLARPVISRLLGENKRESLN